MTYIIHSGHGSVGLETGVYIEGSRCKTIGHTTGKQCTGSQNNQGIEGYPGNFLYYSTSRGGACDEIGKFKNYIGLLDQNAHQNDKRNFSLTICTLCMTNYYLNTLSAYTKFFINVSVYIRFD